MLSWSSRGAAVAVTAALAACSAKSDLADVNLRDEAAVPATALGGNKPLSQNPNLLVGSSSWNADGVKALAGGESAYKLSLKALSAGVLPSVRLGGEQWYQVGAVDQPESSFLVRARMVPSGQQGDSELLQVAMTISTGSTSGRWFATMDWNPVTGGIDRSSGWEGVREANSPGGVSVVAPSADEMGRLIGALYTCVAYAGTDYSSAVSEELRARLAPSFDDLQQAVNSKSVDLAPR